MSQSRRIRRANGMKGSAIRKALESNTPLNSLYALVPQDQRKALDRFVRCFGLNLAMFRKALESEL